MSTNLHLLRIEFRRNAGLYFFPFLILAGVLLAMDYLPPNIVLWKATAFTARKTIFFLGPLTAGLAAWTAGRNRAHEMEELLASTPFPGSWRDLLTSAGATLWGCAAYAIVAAGLLVVAFPSATWGMPPVSYLLEGLLGLIAYAALGFAAGTYVRSRFVVPLVPVVLYMAQGMPLYFDSQVRYLTVDMAGDIWPSAFYRAPLAFQLARSGWLLSVAAIGGAAILVKHRRTRTTWGALAAALLLALLTANALLNFELDVEEAHLAPYEPTCRKGAVVTVCVHPAYAAVLPQLLETANRLAAPLAGVRGTPTRLTQQPELDGPFPKDMAPFVIPEEKWALSDETIVASTFASRLAQSLATDCATAERTWNGNERKFPDLSCMTSPTDAAMEAQLVIAHWLLMQVTNVPTAPVQDDIFTMYHPQADSRAAYVAFKRFAALTPAEQQAWLVEHFADLRAGRLTLADLP